MSVPDWVLNRPGPKWSHFLSLEQEFTDLVSTSPDGSVILSAIDSLTLDEARSVILHMACRIRVGAEE